MPHVTPDQLEEFLTEYGWTFEPAGTNLWKTGFQGEARMFPMQIRLTSTCVSFDVTPWPDLSLASPQIDFEPSEASRQMRELLELNGRLQIVKLGVGEDGELLLSCQVLAAGFDFDMLSRILGIIGYYAEELAPLVEERLETARLAPRPELLS